MRPASSSFARSSRNVRAQMASQLVVIIIQGKTGKTGRPAAEDAGREEIGVIQLVVADMHLDDDEAVVGLAALAETPECSPHPLLIAVEHSIGDEVRLVET